MVGFGCSLLVFSTPNGRMIISEGCSSAPLYFLFVSTRIMKSPSALGHYASGLCSSAVYNPSQSKTATADPRKYLQSRADPLDYSQSAVFGFRSQRPLEAALRNTIGSPERIEQLQSRTKLDGFLRNTSYFSMNASQKNEASSRVIRSGEGLQQTAQAKQRGSSKMEVGSAQEGNKTFENAETNYNKIMEKLDKKQKLLVELKKLSEFKISDSLRLPGQLDKSARLETDTPKRNDRNVSNAYPIFGCSSNVAALGYRKKEDLSRSTADNNRCREDGNYLKEKIINRCETEYLTESKYVKNKNPEDEGFKKNKSNYYTPKIAKGEYDSKIENKWTPRPNYPKTATNFDLERKDYLKDPFLSSSTSLSYTSLLRDSYSSVLSLKKESIANKSIKDIRQLAETKTMKNCTIYSATKQPTINDFELQKSLGEGKFGTVYQAVHKQTNYTFALKKISKSTIKSNFMIDQFLQEIKIQSYCNHENILKLYGFFDDSDYIYLILEYMEEGTLFTHLKKTKTLTEEEAAVKLQQVAEAITYLHEKGIAHRDIKPENIVMSNGVGKLCDFGWAAICNERRKTYCGTFDYAAPEIIEGSEYDMSVDLWCLGVLAYELMVGKAPFYHISRKQTVKRILNVESSAIEFPTTLSKNAVSFINNLIKKKPEERMNGEDILKHPFLQQVKQRVL